MTHDQNKANSREDPVEALAGRLRPLVPGQQLPCGPGVRATAEWVARQIEAGYTRGFAVNTEGCVGPHCTPAILAELKQQGATPEDCLLVSTFISGDGLADLLRAGPLAGVLSDALYAPIDLVLRQVRAAQVGEASPARCVRLGHDVVVLLSRDPKVDWLVSGAREKVWVTLAKLGCDPRAALNQDVDLAQGGKLWLSGLTVTVTRRWGKLRTRLDEHDPGSSRPPAGGRVAGSWRAQKQPRPRGPRWLVGPVQRVLRACATPVRVLRGTRVGWPAASVLAAGAGRYVAGHRAGVALAACLMAALAGLGLVASDVYANMSGETRAVGRPAGFYVGQYNKAGPWGKEVRPYGLYIPPHLRGQSGPFPMIVYLHGYGERSPRQLFAAGLPVSIATRFGEGKKNGAFEFVALFLNDPSGYWSANSKEVDAALEVLDYVMVRHSIDRRRVYLTGASSGGGGAWQLAMAEPARWAAIAPLGAVYTPRPDDAPDIPAWVFHGEDDDTAPIATQRKLAKSLADAGKDVRFTEYRGKGHTVSAETYDGRQLYDWLTTKSRAD